MRHMMLIDILKRERRPIKRPMLAAKMNLSESTIRNLILEIDRFSLTHGFLIENIRGQGLVIKVKDESKFDAFIQSEAIQANEYADLSQKSRIDLILFYLFQATEPMTIDWLAEKTGVSRTTLRKDLKAVDEVLIGFNLELERKARVGLFISGSEQNFRRAFSHYVFESPFYVKPIESYQIFEQNIPVDVLKHKFKEILSKYNLQVDDYIFENLITHLKILLFRVSTRNFIKQAFIDIEDIQEKFFKLASEINALILEQMKVSLPELELQFLALHFSSKLRTNEISEAVKQATLTKIKEQLHQIDNNFKTSFATDEELIQSLFLHLIPLLKRLTYDIQLENPLIDEIYCQYSNVFLIAHEFSSLIEKEYDFKLSRDEIGYFTLHFASHFERLKLNALNQIKRLVVVCVTGGGSANLLKLKIEQLFSEAIVLTTAKQDLSEFDTDLPDLFLSTLPMETSYKDVPIIQIKQFLDEKEIRDLKEAVFLKSTMNDIHFTKPMISSLFSSQFFRRLEGGDYLQLLESQALQMVEAGYAVSGFETSVLERERLFTTIYGENVAGPHGMKLNAIKNCVGVTILEKPIKYEGRMVQIIFLLNLDSKHLFLQKEMSRLMIHLIENESARDRLIACQTLEHFVLELERLS